MTDLETNCGVEEKRFSSPLCSSKIPYVEGLSWNEMWYNVYVFMFKV